MFLCMLAIFDFLLCSIPFFNVWASEFSFVFISQTQRDEVRSVFGLHCNHFVSDISRAGKHLQYCSSWDIVSIDHDILPLRLE